HQRCGNRQGLTKFVPPVGPRPLPAEGRVLRVPNFPRCVLAPPIGDRGKPTRPMLPTFPSGDSTRAAGTVRDSRSSSLRWILAPSRRREEFYESPISPIASWRIPSGIAGSPHVQCYPRSPRVTPPALREQAGTHEVRPSGGSSPPPGGGKSFTSPQSPPPLRPGASHRGSRAAHTPNAIHVLLG
ncbi:MAG: hypothetical protein RIS76_2945, partial [Verrucomicrobiota bacterium]